MKAVVQRIKRASVTINGNVVAGIDTGLLVLLGIEDTDEELDADYIAAKICVMRIFSDDLGKMNLALNDINGELLVVSQFTLHASTKKGNRPSFIKAARPEKAIPLYETFISACSKLCKNAVKTGQFGADMQIELINDGPVTIILDSKNKE